MNTRWACSLPIPTRTKSWEWQVWLSKCQSDRLFWQPAFATFNRGCKTGSPKWPLNGSVSRVFIRAKTCYMSFRTKTGTNGVHSTLFQTFLSLSSGIDSPEERRAPIFVSSSELWFRESVSDGLEEVRAALKPPAVFPTALPGPFSSMTRTHWTTLLRLFCALNAHVSMSETATPGLLETGKPNMNSRRVIVVRALLS